MHLHLHLLLQLHFAPCRLLILALLVTYVVLQTDYSELAILIHWPKAGTQGRPAFDVKEAWKREAGYRAAAEKERAAETAAREAERKKYMAQFNPAAAEEEEGEEEAEAKEDEDGDEHTDEDADDEGEGDDEEEE